MRVYVKCIIKNLAAFEEKCIADGPALLLDSHILKYPEAGEEKAVHVVTFRDDALTLERKAEISSVTNLLVHQKGTSTVTSPFGNMEMETYTESIECSKNFIACEYSVYSQNEKVLDQRIEWHISYIN